LAALARTHSTFQREADMALYDTIFIKATSNNSFKCLKTLAKNPEKAAFVRSLIVEYYNCRNREVMNYYLLKSLINMVSLSDFRARLHPDNTEVMEGLVKILWSVLCEILILSQKTNDECWRCSQGHFRLQTLYCHNDLDISQIIKSQTDLQILGLYNTTSSNKFKTLRELHNAKYFLPIVFMLEHENHMVIGHIGIFPSLYSADRRATIHQVLARSFCKDQGKSMVSKVENIAQLSIYLIDDSHMPSIYSLAKDMALTFPRIDRLNLWFTRGCEIVSFLLTVTISVRHALSKGYMYHFSHTRSSKKTSPI
jgi:hypothetical protein